MPGFVARRLLYLVPVLIAASLLPGDLAYVILGDQATPEKVAALRHDMGLDQPIWWRYLSWLGHVQPGEFCRGLRDGKTGLAGVSGARRQRGRPLDDRRRLRHAVGPDLSVRDPADLSVCRRVALVARNRIR